MFISISSSGRAQTKQMTLPASRIDSPDKVVSRLVASAQDFGWHEVIFTDLFQENLTGHEVAQTELARTLPVLIWKYLQMRA